MDAGSGMIETVLEVWVAEVLLLQERKLREHAIIVHIKSIPLSVR